MQKARTLMGVEYQYSGSLETGLIIHKKVDVRITADAIKLINSDITNRSPVLMGACRDNPTQGSIGEVLKKNGYSPQYLSYVIPLLVEDGFCKASESKPFKIMKQNKTSQEADCTLFKR